MEHKIPAFPDGLRETSLQRLTLSGLLNHDQHTEDRFFEACTSQGFFLLDLTESTHGKSLLSAAERMHDLAATAFKLPQETKSAIGFDKTGCLFGWKASGITDQADRYKRKDVGQFFNVSKDDVLENSGRKEIPYPSPLKEEIEETGLFRSFTQEAHRTGTLILECLERKLNLPRGSLTSRHRIRNLSGDHVRLTYGPGDPHASGSSGMDEQNVRITTSGHTDFGSVTILFNWLGGLQIENRESECWEWVKPAPGHAIVNLGDAMVEFGGRRLKSGKHRVVAAPGEQAKLERYSVVYFVRPEDDVILENLVDVQAGVASKSPGGSDSRSWKAGDWILHRSRQLGNNIPQSASTATA